MTTEQQNTAQRCCVCGAPEDAHLRKWCLWCYDTPATGTANSPEGRFPSCTNHKPSRYWNGYTPTDAVGAITDDRSMAS